MPPLLVTPKESIDSAPHASSSRLMRSLAKTIKVDEQDLSDNHRGDVRRTMQVSFATKKTVKAIPHHQSFSSKEKADAWVTRKDHQLARDEVSDVIRLLDQGILPLVDHGGDKDQEYSATGIKCTRIHAQCRKNRMMASMAVFSEQDTQQWDGYTCEDLIAMSYMEFTDGPKNKAYLAGVMMSLQACGTDALIVDKEEEKKPNPLSC